MAMIQASLTYKMKLSSLLVHKPPVQQTCLVYAPMSVAGALQQEEG
ncbi:hypothetical protein ACU8KH_03874 [Lachancea thermotolerans]